MEDEFNYVRDGNFYSWTLKSLLENTNDYVFIKDKDLVYRGASKAVMRLLGMENEERIEGKTDYDIFPRDTAEKYRAEDMRILGGMGDIEGLVESLPDRDGNMRWARTRKSALLGAGGDIIGICGTSRDIELGAASDFDGGKVKNYLDLIDHIPGGVGLLHARDGAFYLDFANSGCFEAQHNTRESWAEYMNGRIMEVIYEPDRQAVIDEYARVAASPGETGSADYRVFGTDGKLHWVNIRFRTGYKNDGIQYYYSTYTDLDAKKQAEQKLFDSTETLRETINNSDIQYFTYFPERRHISIYALNSHYSVLPKEWDDYPESFIAYIKPSDADAAAYRDMVRRIHEGDNQAECTIQMAYEGAYLWLKVKLTAVRDENGQLVKALGYSVDVTARKKAEERLRQERLRLKSLEGDIFEAFSFNITKNSSPEILTRDGLMLSDPIDEKALNKALAICPELKNSPRDTRDILLRAAARIPDTTERERFIAACSGSALRAAFSQGHYSSELRYRRRIGQVVHRVSTTAEVLPDPETGDLIAFFYTRDINSSSIGEEIKAHIMGKKYESVSYLDLQSGRMHIESAAGAADAGLEGLLYADALNEAAERSVHEDEKDSFLSKLSLASVLAALEENAVYTIFFTKNERDEALPGSPCRRMQNDVFYLDGSRDVIVFLLTDVTAVFEQERESREKLAAALAAAEQASVAKTEFLSRMSHEIRTPMNAIIGLDAIALQAKELSPALEDNLRKIGISARFLLSLINDILDMSRIESGRMALKNESFSFEQLINGINTIMYEQCRENGLDYDCVLKTGTEDSYIGDATKLQQVLINILGNAVKFTPCGGKIHFMVTRLTQTKQTARMRFEISDTGIGIDEDFLPQLFEPFLQEERGLTSVYGGTGLGLAISKNIVNLMGGDISVRSIKNVGSEFTVEVELGLSPDAVRRRALLSPGLRPLDTLIVDDDVIVCRHTQLVLAEAGMKAEWVDSGAGAVEKVAHHRRKLCDYDLILLDWQMPDMDGIETARRIREIAGPDVTIIIMTAYGWADIEARAKAAGVDRFMRKPVFVSSLAKTYENIILGKEDNESAHEAPQFDFSGRRVLLAEDNDINAEIARNILELKGIEVDAAKNGAEAAEAFARSEQGYYDLILMDVRMPVMDGLEAARAIRAMHRKDSRSVPILAMTANAFQEDVVLSLEAGMNAHLAKPIEPEELYRAIAEALGMLPNLFSKLPQGARNAFLRQLLFYMPDWEFDVSPGFSRSRGARSGWPLMRRFSAFSREIR